MDKTSPTFQEFRAYWQLSEELIANASKDDLAEVARILALQAAQCARKYGELQLPDLSGLLPLEFRWSITDRHGSRCRP